MLSFHPIQLGAQGCGPTRLGHPGCPGQERRLCVVHIPPAGNDEVGKLLLSPNLLHPREET